MTCATKKSNTKQPVDENVKSSIINILNILLFLLFVAAVYFVILFQFIPNILLTDSEVNPSYDLKEASEADLRKLEECMIQVKASESMVKDFFKKIPQTTFQGKCFVACILKKKEFIINNKVQINNVIALNQATNGVNGPMLVVLKQIVIECADKVKGISEKCEYASEFFDCMNMKTKRATDDIERSHQADSRKQIASDPDDDDDDDEMLITSDEL